MIDHITGILLKKTVTDAIIKVGGIGFAVSIPVSTSEQLTAVGSEVTLVTYLYVREDQLALYGFHTFDERDLFVQLLGISGVGPKMGLAILSRFDPYSLSEAIASGESRRLTTVPGIGKKKAERLMLELRDKLGIKAATMQGGTVGQTSAFMEAVRALEALGFTLSQAEDNVRSAQQSLGEDTTVEMLVKQALKR